MTEFVKVAGVETPVEVAQILNKIIDEKGNIDLDNLSEVGEKRFSDLSSSITNVKNSVSSLTTTVNGKIGATVSKAANGYIKFTNGVTFQWGGSVFTTSGYWLNFPITFPSCCVHFGMNSSFGGSNMGTIWNGFNASSNIQKHGCWIAATKENFSYWYAIGY